VPRIPDSAQLLDVWETASTAMPARRAVVLLAAAYPDQTPEELARLSVGERDAQLLVLRAKLFGPDLSCVSACPRCGDRLELVFQVADVLIPAAPGASPLAMTVNGFELSIRPPDSTDLEALWSARGDADPAVVLLGRCVIDARRDGRSCRPDRLPKQVVRAIARRLAEADPQALVELALSCLACAHSWLANFDIASFLWQEVDAWARRLLNEVGCLARAYGWREADVLALSPYRRQYYLEMAAG
jgi:hypothetical protein